MNIQATKKNALVVEDNKMNQTILRQFLLKLGFGVDVADDGEIACELCLQNLYDFIFMDIHMPVMDGYTATHQIRNTINPNSEAVIIAVTSDAQIEDRMKCLTIGMNEHVPKPITFEKIKQILSNFY